MSDREKYVWGSDDVEVTPTNERDVERRLEATHFDPGEDDYGDWFSGADR